MVAKNKAHALKTLVIGSTLVAATLMIPSYSSADTAQEVTASTCSFRGQVRTGGEIAGIFWCGDGWEVRWNDGTVHVWGSGYSYRDVYDAYAD